jgi:hypothetical protein
MVEWSTLNGWLAGFTGTAWPNEDMIFAVPYG